MSGLILGCLVLKIVLMKKPDPQRSEQLREDEVEAIGRKVELGKVPLRHTRSSLSFGKWYNGARTVFQNKQVYMESLYQCHCNSK